MAALVIIGVFLVLVLAAVPIITAIGLAGAAGVYAAGFGDMMFIAAQRVLEGVDSAALVAVPFFILAGNLLNALGMTDRIFAFATAVVGHVRGGLAQVNILASLFFSGISGAAVADCAALGTVEVKAMKARGYTAEFAGAITAASSIVGPIFPPSIPILIYAYVATESVGRLFLAGILPALAITLGLMIYVWVLARIRTFPVEPRARWSEIGRKAMDGIFAIAAPIIILTCMLTGVATASEAGVVTCFYTLLLGVYYRSLTIGKVIAAARATVYLSAMVLLMLGFSTIIAWVLAITQVPQALAEITLTHIDQRWLFILIYILFFLVLGMLFDTLSAMVILMPIVLPIVDMFGIDRVHFGIVTVFALMIGVLTPPLGIALYVMMDITQRPFEVLVRSVLPFLIPLLLVLLLVAFVPEISLFLPNLIMGERP